MIKKIESKDNSIIKLCQRLSTKKYRDKEALYLIEGPNLLEEAIKNGAEIKYILASEDFDIEVASALEGCDIYLLGNRLFSKISLTETPQGVMAIVKKSEVPIERLTGSPGNVLVLDKLQDPGNIGTMIRTADAAGFQAVVLLKGSGDVYSPKVVRAAAGSLFRVPIVYMDDYDELVASLKKANKKIVATGFETDKFYYDVDIKENTAIVIGNEGNGVSKELFDLADEIVKIPMKGNIESLNAAVAAGILMYESMR